MTMRSRARAESLGTIQKPAVLTEWFKLAESLGRLGDDLLAGYDPPLNVEGKVTAGALFVQVQKSIRASLVLAERGLPGDANAVLRSAVESVIALHALEADPGFMVRLVGDHFSHHRKQARAFVRGFGYSQDLDQADIQRLNRTADGADAEEHGFYGKVKPIIWADEAKKHCPILYDLVYRPLSTYGTHVSTRRLDEHLKTDQNGRVVGLNRGPTTEGLNFTLKFACGILLSAARVASNRLERPGFEDRLRFQTRRFGKLSDQDCGHGTSRDGPQ